MKTYAVVDIETTGHSSKNGDRMLQFAVVFVRDWQIVQRYSTFIHPERAIPHFIQDLTGITDVDIADAQPFEAHAQKIYDLLQDCVFVAHNTDFDLPFLQAELKRVGLPLWRGQKIDTVELAKVLYPTALSYKLGDLAQELRIPLSQAHRADEDAEATAELLIASFNKLQTLPLNTIEQMHKLSFQLKTNIASLFFEVLAWKRQRISTEAQRYYHELALSQPVMQHTSTKEVSYPHTDDDKIQLMQSRWPHFEKRQAQFEMMDTIYDTLTTKREVVIEASTGIGKTVGYLLPAVTYALQHHKKIAISVYTSHLLDQLYTEELPKVEQMLGVTIQKAVLKGKRHYIDLKKVRHQLAYPKLNYDETLTLMQVLNWLTTTTTGDVNEINVTGGGHLVIEKLRKDQESKRTTPFDYYHYAIAQSEQAQIIVTNHAMVLADAERERGLFSQVDGFIFDEAHQMVQSAMQQEACMLIYSDWKYYFGQIGTIEDERLFSAIVQVNETTHRVSQHTITQATRAFERMVTSFDQTLQQLMLIVKAHWQSTTEDKQLVFLDEITLPTMQNVAQNMQHFIDQARDISSQFSNEIVQLTEYEQHLLSEWRYAVQIIEDLLLQWDAISHPQKQQTTWLEVDRRGLLNSLRIIQKPIETAHTINHVIAPLRQQAALIWTSGTMTVPQNKTFITEQLGIDDDVALHQLQAPSSYYNGAQTFIVSDMPDIQKVSQQTYIEHVAHAITLTVRATKGRCFVLFTSQDMLKKTVELIEESGLLQDYMLFAQGVTSGSRMRILQSFQKFSHAVLFGTNSFWEGVDVPGDALASVIVVRLPFSTPNAPLFKARSAKLTAAGSNAFQQLALPEAILRFKQGFGRLIRSSHDKGAFIVLDRRIETKSYGASFIKALPEIKVHKVSLTDMVLQLENWYNKKDEEN